jgi:hypothetical protein
MPDTASTTKYQCRHIFTDGRRCASPCLRQEEFCYYHHTTRRPIENPRQRRSRRSTFNLPLPEDRSAIQHSIGEVLRRIAANDIDPRRAGLLLYGLQIASINLPKPKPTIKPTRHNSEETTEEQTVEEITTDPTLGILAPRTEITQPEERLSTVGRLLKKMASSERHPQESTTNELQTQPTILPTLNAESNPTSQSHHKISNRLTTGCPTSGPSDVGFRTTSTINAEPNPANPLCRHPERSEGSRRTCRCFSCCHPRRESAVAVAVACSPSPTPKNHHHLNRSTSTSSRCLFSFTHPKNHHHHQPRKGPTSVGP